MVPAGMKNSRQRGTNVRLGLKLIVAILTLIAPAASYAGCDESRSEQSRKRQALEDYIDGFRKQPKETLSKYELSVIQAKRDYTRLETAIAICPFVERTYGVSNVWYSFSGDLYVLPHELSIPEANRISGEVCSREAKSKKLSIYFVDRLSVLKMNSLRDIEKLGDLEKSYLRVCQD